MIENLLAETVNFTIEATGCCGTIPRNEIAENLDYINGAGVFNFSQDQALVQKIKAARPDFANDTIGIADNDYVLIYHLDEQNKVNKIRVAATYKLFVSN